jgi:hypothetical protein
VSLLFPQLCKESVHKFLDFVGLHFDFVCIVSCNSNGYKLNPLEASILNSVMLGQYCRTYQNNLSQLKFFVVGVLSIMATEKINLMMSKEHFEGLLKYYVKMTIGQFVE